MQLAHMTWPEVERYLEAHDGIIIPTGSTEQHGPMGLIGTDHLCPEAIAHAVARDDEVVIGPSITVGMAQHHLAFPGTISLRPATLISVIRDTVMSLSRHGFRHIYFLNGHGGNVPTVQAAFSEIYADSTHAASNLRGEGPPRCRLANWFTLPDVAALARELYGDAEGQHATPSEVSVTQFACPEHIKSAALPPSTLHSSFPTDADDFRRAYPDGRMGSDSSLATPDHGRRFVEVASRAVKADFARFCRT
ncbi:MAG: creatininase family protein [Myxococcales bacterium FL481]|nr:MAG: creatininase family protein [Myxococcales bacterium FL481]